MKVRVAVECSPPTGNVLCTNRQKRKEIRCIHTIGNATKKKQINSA